MKKLIFSACFALAGFLGLLNTAHAEGFTLKSDPKIAMLYISPTNDGGWTQAFDEARQRHQDSVRGKRS